MNIKKLFGDPKKILKFTILTAGALVVSLVAAIGMTYATSVPQFCAVCHVMKPETATWEASSHSKVNCVTCHVDAGLVSALKYKLIATKELYRYVTGTYELPIRMTEEMPDSRCLQCHSANRIVSPADPNLNIPHERHAAQKVSCIKCHQGVAHGNIASRGLTMAGDLGQWDKSKGAKVMSPEHTLPSMDLCMDCHGRRGATLSCEACHNSSMRPDSHRNQSFLQTHGKLAEKDIAACDVCHSFIKAPGTVSPDHPEEDPVARYLESLASGSGLDYADYARTNEYCVACHQKAPASHNDGWSTQHGKAAGKDDRGCLICHSPRTDVKGTTARGACSACHPGIHKTPWRLSHPVPVPGQSAAVNEGCLQCHSRDVCGSCHKISGKTAR